MVDALRRAHHAVEPRGAIIDIHPTAVAASVDVGPRTVGPIDAGDAPARHTAAAAALTRAIADGLFAVEQTLEFDFYTHGDTIDELRDYIVETWRSGRIHDDVVARTREALRGAPLEKPRVRERVCLTKLRPLFDLA